MRKLLAILGLMLLTFPAMAVTYDITPNYANPTGPTEWPGTLGAPSVLTRTIDCLHGVTGSVNGETTITLENDYLTTSSVYIIYRIPAKTVVYGISVSVQTAEGSAVTFGVGDSSSATKYMSAVNGNSVAASNSMATYATVTTPTTALTLPIGMGKYYAAVDYIRITPNAWMRHAKLRFRVTAAQYK